LERDIYERWRILGVFIRVFCLFLFTKKREKVVPMDGYKEVLSNVVDEEKRAYPILK
jgi:hypothetical protein